MGHCRAGKGWVNWYFSHAGKVNKPSAWYFGEDTWAQGCHYQDETKWGKKSFRTESTFNDKGFGISFISSYQAWLPEWRVWHKNVFDLKKGQGWCGVKDVAVSYSKDGL